MTEDEAFAYAGVVMESFGISIEKIPEAKKKKTPDFKFSWGDEKYVVEMKQREAEWLRNEQEEAALSAGEVVHKSESIGFHPTLAERITYGSGQISAYQPEPSTFKLVWYCTYGSRSELAVRRIITTLLGDVFVVELGTDRQWAAYFFDDNLFVQLGDAIDGAIVAELVETKVNGEIQTRVTLHLVLNPYSSRYEKLRFSHLAKALPEGTIDPLAREAAGEVLIVDSAADRTSERATLNYLGEKYQIIVPQMIRMGHMAAIVRDQLNQQGGAGESE